MTHVSLLEYIKHPRELSAVGMLLLGLPGLGWVAIPFPPGLHRRWNRWRRAPVGRQRGGPCRGNAAKSRSSRHLAPSSTFRAPRRYETTAIQFSTGPPQPKRSASGAKCKQLLHLRPPNLWMTVIDLAFFAIFCYVLAFQRHPEAARPSLFAGRLNKS